MPRQRLIVTIEDAQLEERRALGSVNGIFPVLWVGGIATQR